MNANEILKVMRGSGGISNSPPPFTLNYTLVIMLQDYDVGKWAEEDR